MLGGRALYASFRANGSSGYGRDRFASPQQRWKSTKDLYRGRRWLAMTRRGLIASTGPLPIQPLSELGEGRAAAGEWFSGPAKGDQNALIASLNSCGRRNLSTGSTSKNTGAKD